MIKIFLNLFKPKSYTIGIRKTIPLKKIGLNLLILFLPFFQTHAYLLYEYPIHERSQQMIYELILMHDACDLDVKKVKEYAEQDLSFFKENSIFAVFNKIYNETDKKDIRILSLNDIKKQNPVLKETNKDDAVLIALLNIAGLREYKDNQFYYLRFIRIANLYLNGLHNE